MQEKRMNDLISRQDALDAICDNCDAVKASCPHYPCGRYVALEKLQSAQPEQKKGKWVRYDGDWLKTMCKCSECGAIIDINEKYRNFFCYHCGADMRE